MVVHPWDYAWLSYRANAEGGMDTLISTHSLIHMMFSAKSGKPRASHHDGSLMREVTPLAVI
jgi:hypothetical protein